MTTYYKFLNKGRVSPLQNWQWPRVGTWTERIERINACASGYHACRPAPHFDLLEWHGDNLYEIELRGKIIEVDTKVVAQQARLVREVKTWNARTQRLFACDCAARILKIYEAKYPNDKRPREAIRVARAFANGKATIEELNAAADADAAAYATAANAAAYAAYAAYATAATAANAAAYAAYATAACAAASDAAAYATASDAAAYAAAKREEKQWQVARMMKYINGEIS